MIEDGCFEDGFDVYMYIYIYIYIYNLPVDTLSISVINIVRDRMKLCYDNSV